MFRVKPWRRRRHVRRGWEESKYRNIELFFYTSLLGKSMQLPGIESDCFKINILLTKKADFLVAYSTMVGNTSFRCWSTKHGTWFISSLMEKLNTYGHNMHVLTNVNQHVNNER